jgi:geranylgeranyl pyrophosphate synthase
MPEPVWPSSAEIHAEVAERLRSLLDECGGMIAEIGGATLSIHDGVLSETPHSLTTVLVAGACISASGDWRVARWPAVAAECMMAAADLFDDAADADIESPFPAGVMLTAAAGLLSLASIAAVRSVDDGVDPGTAVALIHVLGSGFASAANGQAANLQTDVAQVDALTAYRQSAAKSGPLGALIAQLGARTATADPAIVQLLADFGRALAVRSQLLNDARDAAPEAAKRKADVRAGAHTVPLAFTGSSGAPAALTGAQLEAWEQAERSRIAAGGGLVAAQALAEAERLRAVQALDRLETLGHAVTGLRQLL